MAEDDNTLDVEESDDEELPSLGDEDEEEPGSEEVA